MSKHTKRWCWTLSKQTELFIDIVNPFDNTRTGTGVNNIIESLLADVVFGPNIPAQYFAVAQPRPAVLIVYANNIIYAVNITAPYYFPFFSHADYPDKEMN